jgi:hypothetical protein
VGGCSLTPNEQLGLLQSATKLSSSHHKVMCSQQDTAEEEFEATKGRQSESVCGCSLTPNEQFFNYIMAATRYI